MDLKKIVLDYLDTVKERNINSISGNQYRNRNLYFIYNLISDTKFNNNTKCVRDYLSSYGTFYDHYTFYYDEYYINNLDKKQLAEVVCCEIINFLQSYYDKPKMSLISMTKIRSFSLLTMYQIGLVEKRVRYALFNRNDLISSYIKDHGELDVIVFAPNEHARLYLKDKFLYGGMGEDIGRITKIRDGNYLMVIIHAYYIQLNETSGLRIRIADNEHEYMFYSFENNKFSKLKQMPSQFIIDHYSKIDLNDFLYKFEVDEIVLRKLRGKYSLGIICQSQSFSEKFMREFEDNMNFTSLSFNEKIVIPCDLLEKYKRQVSWADVFKNQKFDENFISKHYNTQYANVIAKYQKLSIEFIRQHKEDFNYENLITYQILDNDFVKENFMLLPLQIVKKFQPHLDQTMLDSLIMIKLLSGQEFIDLVVT